MSLLNQYRSDSHTVFTLEESPYQLIFTIAVGLINVQILCSVQDLYCITICTLIKTNKDSKLLQQSVWDSKTVMVTRACFQG